MVASAALSSGSSAESVCKALRTLLASAHVRYLTMNDPPSPPALVLLCDLKRKTNDTIEVTLVSFEPNFKCNTINSIHILILI